MKIHEYQSKSIFTKFGIPVPRGRVAVTAEEAKQICEELGTRVVIKSQVLVGGRGKAGGIRLVNTPTEAEEVATTILRMEIKNLPVRKILVEEAANIIREIYLGITNDRSYGKPLIMASASGGIDIEEIAQSNPENIYKVLIDPLLGLRDYQIRDLASNIDLPRQFWRSFIEILQNLWQTYVSIDATLVEINPLVITTDNRLIALDAKIIIDDNAIFRHPDLSELRDLDYEAPAESEARKYGLSYIKLDGHIGCMVNGAGLAMATMDLIKLAGGEPANFLDIGGGASAEKVSAALRIILTDPNVKAVLFNIFGGITRCDEVAHGILTALAEAKPQVPMVTRLVGTNADEGRALLAQAKMITADTLIEAAQKVVNITKGA
jgi:succinyl-CoA synthetase beta subunit